MHVFANTDTRILDVDGTIIIITLFKAETCRYRILIDGIMKGFLIENGEDFRPEKGTDIPAYYLTKINELARRHHRINVAS
ncbi:hypothetical protein [Pedobacter aquatilis]|uniref:hypothetical protein n=1 Tax=Pedobacter aquatilis TaxID=351343 RepID=UPI00292DDE26|nr:hypothetical protein [Pedobacter aquatilis]